MFEVIHVEGKLVLVKVVSPITLEEISQADKRMAQVEAQVSKVVICADYRATTLLNPTESDALLSMFRGHNDHIERSSILVSEQSAMAVLQMSRVVRQANLPTRRSFKDWRELAQWLGEVLSDQERERLSAIFG